MGCPKEGWQGQRQAVEDGVRHLGSSLFLLFEGQVVSKGTRDTG
jgi:hypothetical protein